MLSAMTITTEVGTRELADLLKKVRAGDEVVLTERNKPVAKLVPATEPPRSPAMALRVRSIRGHRVLTPEFSQAQTAEEMFGRR